MKQEEVKRKRPSFYNEKPCDHCGEAYKPQYYFQKYCSGGCRYLSSPRYGFIAPKDMKECANCGTTERLTVNHIIPRVVRIDNSPENLEVLCHPCNVRAYFDLSKVALTFYFESKDESFIEDALSDGYENYFTDNYEPNQSEFDPYIVLAEMATI